MQRGAPLVRLVIHKSNHLIGERAVLADFPQEEDAGIASTIDDGTLPAAGRGLLPGQFRHQAGCQAHAPGEHKAEDVIDDKERAGEAGRAE